MQLIEGKYLKYAYEHVYNFRPHRLCMDYRVVEFKAYLCLLMQESFEFFFGGAPDVM